MLSQELQNQLRLAVERRLRLSEVIRKCAGSSNFVVAAAATVDDCIEWAFCMFKFHILQWYARHGNSSYSFTSMESSEAIAAHLAAELQPDLRGEPVLHFSR